MSLEPMVDMIGTYAVKHGERGELDLEHQYACLCGEPNYMLCPNFDNGIQGAELVPVSTATLPGYVRLVLGCPARRRGEDHNWRAMNNGTATNTAWVYCVECGTTTLGMA